MTDLSNVQSGGHLEAGSLRRGGPSLISRMFPKESRSEVCSQGGGDDGAVPRQGVQDDLELAAPSSQAENRKAFRSVRKAASLIRKTFTGSSASEHRVRVASTQDDGQARATSSMKSALARPETRVSVTFASRFFEPDAAADFAAAVALQTSSTPDHTAAARLLERAAMKGNEYKRRGL